MLLQQMGLSEDEQLELALELSLQGIYSMDAKSQQLFKTPYTASTSTHYNSPYKDL